MTKSRRKKHKKRSQPGLDWNPELPSGIMREAYKRSRRSVLAKHHSLEWIWRRRNTWIEAGNACGHVPPGAVVTQKSGRTIPHWQTIPEEGSRMPMPLDFMAIYAIVHLRTGRAFVGRTANSPYARFHKHIVDGDAIGKAIESTPQHFVVLLLEKVPLKPTQANDCEAEILKIWQARERAWINKLDAHIKGYNERKDFDLSNAGPSSQTREHVPKPIKRSRHPERITPGYPGSIPRAVSIPREDVDPGGESEASC